MTVEKEKLTKKELLEIIEKLELELKELTRKHEALVARIEGRIGFGGVKNAKA